MKLVALACAAVLLADRPAEACSCLPPPPPCEVYSRAGLVFFGEVTSTASTPDFLTAATFEVEEELKGGGGAKTIVVHGGGMCGAMFTAGQKYFVYASGNGGTWYAGLCGRTRQLDRAQEDLAYARNLPSRDLGEVFGTVQLEDEQGHRAPRAGAIVQVQGTQYAARTDAAGRYKLLVPPGKYTLDVASPGTHVRWRLPKIELLDPAACASEDIVVRFNGRIRGTLRDHTGKPAVNVAVSARSGEDVAGRALTNVRGEYEISGVQAGSYLVAVNHHGEGGPDARAPVPMTLYPGVATEAAAKPVQVARSSLVAKIDFKLPRPLPVYTVAGVVMQKGQPVPNVRIDISTKLGPGSGAGRGSSVSADASGRFTFKDVAGASLSLEVCRPDADPDNHAKACRVVAHTLAQDWAVEVEYPSP